jgi:hypothetical protein
MSETTNAINSDLGLRNVIDGARGVGARFLATGADLYGSYLDSVDSAVADCASFERTLGAQSVYRGFSPLLTTHADLSERFATAVTARARGFAAAGR